METSGLKFHHLGLAVRDEQDAMTFLSSLFYEIGEKVFDPLQNVNLRLCTSDSQPAVEIVSQATGESPIDSILRKSGEGIYHTCYETSDSDTVFQSFEAKGLRVVTVSEPKPAVLFDGKLVSFHRVFGYGLLELIHMD